MMALPGRAVRDALSHLVVSPRELICRFVPTQNVDLFIQHPTATLA